MSVAVRFAWTLMTLAVAVLLVILIGRAYDHVARPFSTQCQDGVCITPSGVVSSK